MLITTARLKPGDRCRTRMVSERWPPMWAPNLEFLPLRVSEPITRMFSEWSYPGGLRPRPVTFTWWILPNTSRYTAYALSVPATSTTATTAPAQASTRDARRPRGERPPAVC